jgi:hypothetical protein
VLLLVAIPAVPVSAAAAIDVDPDEGDIGDEIILTGSGFPVSSELYVFFARQQADVGDEIDEEVTVYSFIGSVVTFFDGRIIGLPFNIPTRLDDGLVLTQDEDVFGGNYYVYVTYENSSTIRAVTSVRVISNATITEFSPSEGSVGTEVEISGEGFVPGEAIIIEYDDEQIDIEGGDEESDEEGVFTLQIVIPESEYGEHTITIRGQDSLTELETTFTVEPNIGVNPNNGEPGSIVLVTGTGFDRNNSINFSFGGTSVTDIVWLVTVLGITNSNGTFAVNLTVPDVGLGSYGILAQDEDDNDIFDSTFFTVESASIPTPTPTVTVTTTITTTIPEQTTITTTVTEEVTTTPIPMTITTRVTEEVTTTPIPMTITTTATEKITSTPNAMTITTTKTEEITTTTQIKGDSQVNVWLPIVTALGAILLTIVVLVIYSSRQRGL